MSVSNKTALDLVAVIRKHVPPNRIPDLLEDLYEIRGNESFRDTIKMVIERLRQK